MTKQHAAAAHWRGKFDDAALQAWIEELRRQLNQPVSLGLVFMGPKFFPHATAVLEILRVHGQIPLLAGCSSAGLIVGAQELEDEPELVVGLYALPGAELRAIHFDQRQVEEATGVEYWPQQTGQSKTNTNGWIVFADPFHLDATRWLDSWNTAYSPRPIVGGLASGNLTEQYTQVYLNGEVFEEGGVAISVGGDVQLASVISQGCTPIGETATITKTKQNLIYQIGNRPAYQALAETLHALSTEEQQRTRGNLFVGLVINEYLEEFHRGDFLIRNLIGGDPDSGVLAIGELPRVGQTIQFQRRDPQAADEDMRVLLTQAQTKLDGKAIYGGCLCSCNGRGHRMFGSPNHDAKMIQEMLGPLGLTGFFCNGEIGPLGGRSFLHGYTASLALFVQK
jgi:small ligand-binding sensory domain FIST